MSRGYGSLGGYGIPQRPHIPYSNVMNSMQIGMHTTPVDWMLPTNTPACRACLTSVKPCTTLDLIAKMPSNISIWAILLHKKQAQNTIPDKQVMVRGNKCGRFLQYQFILCRQIPFVVPHPIVYDYSNSQI
jgi:hypothetical protein